MPHHIRNTINDEITLNIDLAPTILQAANIPIPPVMQGRDIASMYLHDAKNTQSTDSARLSWRKDFYYEWFTGDKVVIPASLALVSKSVKYIIYPEYEYEELFRLKVDPYEEKNVFKHNASFPLTTTRELLDGVKGRFNELKIAAESGVRV